MSKIIELIITGIIFLILLILFVLFLKEVNKDIEQQNKIDAKGFHLHLKDLN